MGIRPAEPGEFSKRAFINGRIDLVQAEAIADLISASSNRAADIARWHYRGRLSSAVEAIREQIASVMAWMEAEIDFPQADLDCSGKEHAVNLLQKQIALIDQLKNTYHEGKIYKEGIVTAILGKPNVGKSSLLNILTGEERAIVTDIPGTTRDILEVPVNIRGIPLRLADTAGIRESLDKIEQIGIERARKLAAQADLTLLVLDISRPLTREDSLLFSTVNKDSTIVILNKTDLPAQYEASTVVEMGFSIVQPISVFDEQGLEELKDVIEKMFTSGHFQPDMVCITNLRHYNGLNLAAEHLERVVAGWDNLPLDLLAMDLREGWRILGEITGSVWTDNLLDDIFQRFCIGK